MNQIVHAPYNRFKIWLKDNNITYAELGNLLGPSETTIAFKINGKSDFLLSEIQLLRNTYNLSDEIFFTDIVA